MSLRFFADHCVPNFVINELSIAGFDVFRLKDHIPIESNDAIVIANAQQLDTILLSLNGDFADIVTYPPANYNGIIALQMKNHPEIIKQIMIILTDYLSIHSDMNHYKGKLFLVEAHRIRVRT